MTITNINYNDNVLCIKCGNDVELAHKFNVKKRRLSSFYRCKKCICKIPCQNNRAVLDVGYNKEQERLLYDLKNQVHYAMDQIWKDNITSRSYVYCKLARDMCIERSECHIAKFTIEQCRQALTIILNWGLSPEFKVK